MVTIGSLDIMMTSPLGMMVIVKVVFDSSEISSLSLMGILTFAIDWPDGNITAFDTAV